MEESLRSPQGSCGDRGQVPETTEIVPVSRSVSGARRCSAFRGRCRSHVYSVRWKKLRPRGGAACCAMACEIALWRAFSQESTASPIATLLPATDRYRRSSSMAGSGRPCELALGTVRRRSRTRPQLPEGRYPRSRRSTASGHDQPIERPPRFLSLDADA